MTEPMQEVKRQPIVSLQQVTKRIGKRAIIDKLSLDLYPGEVFGFLGPNGSGKTTTIRMIVGLMKMSEGEIMIGGQSIKRNFTKAIAQVGAIVENPEMYKYLSGYKNLLHFARMAPGVDKQRIDEVIKLVGLESRIHDKVRTYSLGMRQRLGVAQAMLHRPRLLILDEPTNGLDPAGIRELRDYLRRLAQNEGVSIFVSSHMLSEMELMCDRVAIIQSGKLLDIRDLFHNQQGVVQTVQKYSIELDRPQTAIEALQEFGHHAEVGEDHASIILQADRLRVAEINKHLVESGISVFGIRVVVTSLEDQFLQATGGERIV